MRYREQTENTIDDMRNNGSSAEEINNIIAEQKECIKPSDMFDYVRGMRCLPGHPDLNLSDKSLRQFIDAHRMDISIGDLYRKVLRTDNPIFDEKEVEGSYWLNYINMTNVETALFILFVLEEQKTVEKKILSEHEINRIDKNSLYRIVREYLSMYEKYDFDLPNYDFLYELIKDLFASFPNTPYKDDKDMLLALFKHIYTMPLSVFPVDIFDDKVIKKIKSTDKNIWESELHLSSIEVVRFVNAQYKRESESDLRQWNHDRKAIEPLNKIFTVLGLKGTKDRQIDGFLKKYSISPIAWVRAADAGLIKLPRDDEKSKYYIDSFIQDHLSEFSYDELLDRVINCRVSERATILEMRVMKKIKNEQQVEDDILKRYQEGDISDESLHWLTYNWPKLKGLVERLK